MVEVTTRPSTPRDFKKERLRVLHCRRELLKAQAAMGTGAMDSPTSPVYEPERVPRRRAGSPQPVSRRLKRASPEVNRKVVRAAGPVKKRMKSVMRKRQRDFPVQSDSSDSHDCSCASHPAVVE